MPGAKSYLHSKRHRNPSPL